MNEYAHVTLISLCLRSFIGDSYTCMNYDVLNTIIPYIAYCVFNLKHIFRVLKLSHNIIIILASRFILYMYIIGRKKLNFKILHYVLRDFAGNLVKRCTLSSPSTQIPFLQDIPIYCKCSI